MKNAPSPREFAEILFDAMNSRDLSGLDRRLADDAVFDFPGAGRIKGRKRIVLFLKVLFRRYPRLSFRVEETIAEGDRACAFWSNKGESREKEPYSNRGATLIRVRGGRIVLLSDYFKDTSFTNG